LIEQNKRLYQFFSSKLTRTFCPVLFSKIRYVTLCQKIYLHQKGAKQFRPVFGVVGLLYKLLQSTDGMVAVICFSQPNCRLSLHKNYATQIILIKQEMVWYLCVYKALLCCISTTELLHHVRPTHGSCGSN